MVCKYDRRIREKSLEIVCVLLLTCALLGMPVDSHASEKFYSVQAGTYSLTAIKFAAKQYEMLSKKLGDNDLEHLRIEKGNKYFIIRIGRLPDKADAISLMERVRVFVPDAFILRQVDYEKLNIVKAYTPSAPELEEYYTLQLGNYSIRKEAEERFDSLVRVLIADELKYLRIEMVGRFYSVRIGKFENYGLARDFQNEGGKVLDDAIILKGFMKDEVIVSQYGQETESDTIVIDGKKVSADELSKANSVTQDVSVNPAPVDNIINEASSYYDADDYGKAAELLRKGLAMFPDNADLRAWYGATLLNMRFPDKAYEEYKKAVEISPDVPDYHAGLGFSLLDIYMDRAKSSIEAFQKALDIDPNNVSAIEGLGIVYVSTDRREQAVEMHERLKQLDPEAAERLGQLIESGLEWEER